MIVDVEIDGHTRRVELDRTGDQWVATVDGRTLRVDRACTADGWSLLCGEANRPSAEDPTSVTALQSHDLVVVEREPGELTVHVGGHAVEVRVDDPRAFRARRRDRSAGSVSGVRHVRAPMPGRVVKVLVNAGDAVAAGQGVVVVEAMKMENELRAPGAGRVIDVRTSEGASVDAGAILMTLE